MSKTIATISLGCDKNRVDTEKMLFLLQQAGYKLVSQPMEADILLINTCAFIKTAKEETIATIWEMVEIKRKYKEKKIIVTGCFAQRYGQELRKEIPAVDGIIGVDVQEDIVSMVDMICNQQKVFNIQRRQSKQNSTKRVITTPYHYAYLKIADGCNNRCSYCAIPQIKGGYRSQPIEDLIAEASYLVEQGIKEIILVAQDTTLYGIDIYGRPMLIELLKELTKLKVWKIRLLYAYPERIDRELIELIADNKKIAKYIDIPLQHIDDYILHRMNRNMSSKNIKDLLKMIKDIDKDIAIRSTFIIGFNGETEKRFNALKNFILDTQEIDYVGFFGYSIEEGTAASKFRIGNISQSLINKRIIALEKIWVEKIEIMHKKYKGRICQVIYEGIDFEKQELFGRIEQNSPEIDTKVYLRSNTPLNIGSIYEAEIIDTSFHLTAKVRDL